jgi:TonB family protein
MCLKFLLLLVLVVCLPQVAGAQEAAVNATQVKSTHASTENMAKLSEAARLTASVVKLHNESKFDEALPLAERALKLREEAVGSKHELVAVSLVNLGAVQLGKGKLAKTRAYYKRAREIYESNPDTKGANLIRLYDTLGVLERFSSGDYASAIENYEKGLALREQALAAGHDDIVKNLYALVELYELGEQNDKALAAHRRVIGIMEKKYDAEEAWRIARALERFNCLAGRLKMTKEMQAAQKRIDEIRAHDEERREKYEAERLARPAPDSAKYLEGGVINGKAISKPQPSYPEAAKQARISGRVSVFVTVDEKGTVIEAYGCGHPLLSEASVRAAYAARFTPTTLSGKPVKVNGVITYNFVLML